MVLWKPSDTALLSSYAVYKILLEAGLPPNVVQFVPSDGPVFGDTVTSSEHFCGLNFTGSVPYVGEGAAGVRGERGEEPLAETVLGAPAARPLNV